jgi:hypothetical protein
MRQETRTVKVGDRIARIALGEVGKVHVDVEDELHYEFVPGVTPLGPFSLWGMTTSDNLGTEYNRNDTGVFGTSGGRATHGTRDLGGRIPADASWVLLRFRPGSGWKPPEPWRRELKIDLASGQSADSFEAAQIRICNDALDELRIIRTDQRSI